MPPAFRRPLLTFLEELGEHNDREWFAANKSRYQQDVQGPALAFITAMAPRLRKISRHMTADPRNVGGSLMRVYRDTRFAKDKRPYKTNVGIQFRHVEGKDVHAPGFYFHIEPGSVFLGAGLWHPEREPLAAIRAAIDEKPKAWLAARNAPVFRREFDLAGDSLKRAPAGFAPDHPMIDDLRRTDFIAVRTLSERAILGEKLVDDVAASLASTAPFMRFLCKAQGLAF